MPKKFAFINGVEPTVEEGLEVDSVWLDISGQVTVKKCTAITPSVTWEEIASGGGSGDMLAATYDPQSVEGDAFDTDNHTDGTTNKVYTATEKTKLTNIEASAVALSTVKADADVSDAISKKHSNSLDHSNASDHAQNTDTDLDATFEAALKNTDNHTSGSTNKVFTATEQTKLTGIEASAVALATVKADADVSDAISKKHTEAHALASHSSMAATGLVIENRTDDPASPATGQIWLRTDL